MERSADANSKIRTAAYVDIRRADSAAAIERAKRRKNRLELIQKIKTDDAMFFERYQDNVDGHVPVHRIVQPNPTAVYKKKRHAVADALVDEPIILTTKGTTSSRHQAVGDDEIVIRKIRRRKNRSASPQRRKSIVAANNPPTISLRVESQKAKHKKSRGSMKKRATFVYKEPRAEGEIVTISPSRRTYHATTSQLQNRERGRSRHTVGSLTSGSATDTAVYEEVYKCKELSVFSLKSSSLKR